MYTHSKLLHAQPVHAIELTYEGACGTSLPCRRPFLNP
jgi:hypothetical protein